MTTAIDYKMLQVSSTDPISAAGLMIQNNFKTTANYIDSISGKLNNTNNNVILLQTVSGSINSNTLNKLETISGSVSSINNNVVILQGISGVVNTNTLNYINTISGDASTFNFYFQTQNEFIPNILSTPNSLDLAVDESYLDNSGNTNSLAGFFITNEFAINTGDTINFITNGDQSLFGCYYDINHSFLSAFSNGAAPANAKFVKFNIQKSATIRITKLNLLTEITSKNKFNNIKVNCLGDSITQGYGVTNNTKIYHNLINDHFKFNTVRNYGVAGSCIAPVSGQLVSSFVDRITGMNVDANLVIVFGGVNDYLQTTTAPIGAITDSVDTRTFYGSLKYICEYLIKTYTGKDIIFITPTHVSSITIANPITGKYLNEYVDIIKSVVGGLYGLPVLDLYNTGGYFYPLISLYNMPDGLHPNDLGHRQLANKLISFLNNL